MLLRGLSSASFLLAVCEPHFNGMMISKHLRPFSAEICRNQEIDVSMDTETVRRRVISFQTFQTPRVAQANLCCRMAPNEKKSRWSKLTSSFVVQKNKDSHVMAMVLHGDEFCKRFSHEDDYVTMQLRRPMGAKVCS